MIRVHTVKMTWIGRSCPCLVFVRIFRKILSGVCLLSGFCPDCLSGVCLFGFCMSRFCPLSGFCPDFKEKGCLVSVCPDFFYLDSVRCRDFVWIFRKKAVQCLSVRILLKNNLSGICRYNCLDILGILSVWASIDINNLSEHRHLFIRMWTQDFRTPSQTRTRMSERTLKNS